MNGVEIEAVGGVAPGVRRTLYLAARSRMSMSIKAFKAVTNSAPLIEQ